MLFIIIFNWTCFWLLIKWVFLIKWFMLEQSLSTLLISVDWNRCFFFIFTYLQYLLVLDMCTAERFLLFRVSLFLSVILIFSVFLSLYLSPFPTVNSNTNNICQFCGPFPLPPIVLLSAAQSDTDSLSLPACLFFMRIGALALWLFDWWVHSEPNETITGHCTQHSVLSLQRHSLKDLVKFSLCFAPLMGEPKVKQFRSISPRIHSISTFNTVYRTHRSLDRQFKSKDDAGLVPVENKQHTLFSVFSQDQSQCSLDSSAMQKSLLNIFF